MGVKKTKDFLIESIKLVARPLDAVYEKIVVFFTPFLHRAFSRRRLTKLRLYYTAR